MIFLCLVDKAEILDVSESGADSSARDSPVALFALDYSTTGTSFDSVIR